MDKLLTEIDQIVHALTTARRVARDAYAKGELSEHHFQTVLVSTSDMWDTVDTLLANLQATP